MIKSKFSLFQMQLDFSPDNGLEHGFGDRGHTFKYRECSEQEFRTVRLLRWPLNPAQNDGVFIKIALR